MAKLKMIAVVGLALLGMVLYGCGGEKEEGDQGKVTGKDVMDKMGEAAETTGQFVAQKKDEAVGAWNNAVKAMKDRMVEWDKAAEKQSDQAKAKLAALKKDAQGALTAAEQKIQAAKDASADDWGDAQKAAKEAMDKAKAAVEKAAAEVAGWKTETAPAKG